MSDCDKRQVQGPGSLKREYSILDISKTKAHWTEIGFSPLIDPNLALKIFFT